MYLVVCTFVFTIGLVVHFLTRKKKQCYTKLPISPPTFPILGNLHQLIYERAPPHVVFSRFAKKYGPVFTVWFGDAPVVIINDFYIAKKVLFSNKCHGRQQRETSRLISNGFKGVVTTDASCPAMQYRRGVFKRVLEKHEQNLHKILQAESRRLIEKITEKIGDSPEGTPLDLSDEISITTAGIVLKMIFSIDLSRHYGLLTKLQDMMKWVMNGLTLSNLLYGFPLLRHIPAGKFMFLNYYNKEMFGLTHQQYEKHLKGFDKNNPRDLTDLLMAEQGKNQRNEAKNLDRDHVEAILADMVTGSFETTTSTIKLLILYMSYYPKHAERCRREINEYLKEKHNPNGENQSINQDTFDFKNLHFLQAFLAETLRKTAVLPLGVPHKTVTEMDIQGYTLPEGTTVFVNIDHIHHDEELHEDPQLFNPERFLDADGKYKIIDGYLPFSIGRRNCVGKSVALKTVLFMAVQLLKHFDFSQPDGAKFPESFAYTASVDVKTLFVNCKQIESTSLQQCDSEDTEELTGYLNSSNDIEMMDYSMETTDRNAEIDSSNTETVESNDKPIDNIAENIDNNTETLFTVQNYPQQPIEKRFKSSNEIFLFQRQL